MSGNPICCFQRGIMYVAAVAARGTDCLIINSWAIITLMASLQSPDYVSHLIATSPPLHIWASHFQAFSSIREHFAQLQRIYFPTTSRVLPAAEKLKAF